MRMALSLAKKGIGTASPNPMVGAVLVRDGIVVGKGYHKKAGSAHAEINAIEDAGPNAAGATMYINLEMLLVWVPIGIVVVLICAVLAYLTVKAHRRKVETGNEGLVGEVGTMQGGKIFVHGELWHISESVGDPGEGDSVVVEAVERMTVRVRKI